MAKKVSKHSRAARRNEIEEQEAKSLSKLPRSEKTDITSAIIRATAKKNENLLHSMIQKKELKSKITKKNLQITNLNKEKLERAISLSDKLEGKILKSKQRAKMVQTARKSNWESINSSAIDTLQPKKDETVEQPQEDEMTEDIYEEEVKQPQATNAFALLDEVEC